jgi:hypothetical protein
MRAQYLPITLLAVAGALHAQSDQRSNRVVCAIEATVCARANAARNETVVERSSKTPRASEQLWSVPAWLNIVRINESGSHLLVENAPLGQISVDAPSTLVVLTIYNQGKVQREVQLGELLKTEAARRAAEAAGAWGKALGSPDSDIARYLLATGEAVRVRLSSAQVVAE